VRSHDLIRAAQDLRTSVAAALLVAGLLVSCVLYARATRPGGDPEERADDSKQYLRQMEAYGGTANVLASELREWFAELWTGRRLAFTVALLSLVAAAAARLLLTPLPPQPPEGDPGESQPRGPQP